MIINLDLYVYIYVLLVFFSLLLLTLAFKYFLLVLVLVEVVVMRIGVLFYYIYRWIGLDSIIIYYLVFRVCERVMGLAILVLIIRYSGGDHYFLFNLSKF